MVRTKAEARDVLGLPSHMLLQHAAEARQACSGQNVDLCSILNVKSGACSEDCAFCAQSARHRSDAATYPLVARERVIEAARSAREIGAGRFCVVTSGRMIREEEMERLSGMVSGVQRLSLLPCATLGTANVSQLSRLKEAGLYRYHHNLETSETFFPKICTTHTWRERIATIGRAREAGLSVCSGGIFGLGETWDDRIDLALVLRDLGVDSVPINFLVPVDGTPMAGRSVMGADEALRVIALFRLILPDREIRVCGGRNTVFREQHERIFGSGANGFLIGNYLTVLGRDPSDDLRMIRDHGFLVRRHGA